jgi:hypothetical protein
MPKRVWIVKPMVTVYAGREVAVGEVVDYAYGRNDPTMLRIGYTAEVEPDATIYEHDPTGRLFISAAHRDNFARGWHQEQDGESTDCMAPQRPDATHTSVGAGEDASKKYRGLYRDAGTLTREVARVYWEWVDNHDGKHPSMPDVAANMTPYISERTLRRYIDAIFKIPYPPSRQ